MEAEISTLILRQRKEKKAPKTLSGVGGVYRGIVTGGILGGIGTRDR